ncbi:hypothetical protein [Burkholderia glumae]|uniref:hypothetical protein n=1 Tax=Burkholderia glumae TaxID=337 RepID=UPI000C27BF7B|nr:hypothetical protein [Burkholderia glumae]MCM2493169.1 hypothetical protein [Burkholderia glumae]MCM2544149.1 hypothetical protein [Burkholderia glumae]PJO25014.1 hypothetical protein Y5A_000975 [Burkholderia glumae AU6208]QHE09068.1 hypothetical protein GQR88_00675 [Burkholderia glumae AU6208]
MNTRPGTPGAPGTPRRRAGSWPAPPAVRRAGRLAWPGWRRVLLGLAGLALLGVTFAAWLTPSTMLALLSGFSMCG